jgi:hypothetical protein
MNRRVSLLPATAIPPQARGPRQAGETGGASHAEPDPRRMDGKSVIL